MNTAQAIVEESIHSLQEEGLRFSVDSLAVRMGMSKKTIYKYFPTKEALAKALYQQYFHEARQHAGHILAEQHGQSARTQLLVLYYQAYAMVNPGVFNKFALNGELRCFAEKEMHQLYALIVPALTTNPDTLRPILDGTFEYLYTRSLPGDEVIRTLSDFLSSEKEA